MGWLLLIVGLVALFLMACARDWLGEPEKRGRNDFSNGLPQRPAPPPPMRRP